MLGCCYAPTITQAGGVPPYRLFTSIRTEAPAPQKPKATTDWVPRSTRQFFLLDPYGSPKDPNSIAQCKQCVSTSGPDVGTTCRLASRGSNA